MEGALQKFPGIIESVVFSVPEKRFGEEVGACINMSGDTKDKDEEISSFLREYVFIIILFKKRILMFRHKYININMLIFISIYVKKIFLVLHFSKSAITS